MSGLLVYFKFILVLIPSLVIFAKGATRDGTKDMTGDGVLHEVTGTYCKGYIVRD